jgi:hypothetical protein
LKVPAKTKICAAILIGLFLATYVFAFLPQAQAAVVTAVTVSPKQGKVGDIVHVDGTIETALGNYTIYFDSILKINGTANAVKVVNATFQVPQVRNGTYTVTLQDVKLNHNATDSFTVETSFRISAIVPNAPKQLQEGDPVTIRAQVFGGDNASSYPIKVTVKTPKNAEYYNATLSLSPNSTGTAESLLLYPTDFLPVDMNRHTNYTGTYQLGLNRTDTNTHVADSTFIIGLTNATIYQRGEFVGIKAANYTKPNENATVTIKFGSTVLHKKNVTAINGIITYNNWTVPSNALNGTYTVTVTNASIQGTVKTPRDVQNFTVPCISVKIKATNLNGEPFFEEENATITIYEVVKGNLTQVASANASATGWTENTLQHGGDYKFKVFWKNVKVNETSTLPISTNSSYILSCQVAHMDFLVEDGKTGLPMPFITLALNSSYVTVDNESRPESETPYLTNSTGRWVLSNQLVNASYTIRAYRNTYLLFNTTDFTIPQGQGWFRMNITCPVLSLTVQAKDAKNSSLRGYPIKVYEYAGGLYANATTNDAGNVTFSCTFGIYKLRLYSLDGKIVLNETYYNLINETSFFILRSNIYNAILSVLVVDYFGQPMPNVKVVFQREGVNPVNVTTGADGIALFNNITGGNGLISIYIGGDKPIETLMLYVERSTSTTISLGKYVSVFGMIVETDQFAVALVLIAILMLFAVFFLYRRRKTKTPTEPQAEKKS